MQYRCAGEGVVIIGSCLRPKALLGMSLAQPARPVGVTHFGAYTDVERFPQTVPASTHLMVVCS